MPRSLRLILAALAALILAAAAGACGSDDDDDSSGESGGGGGASASKVIEKDPANAGKSITIGSKNFTEQFILGQIYSQALEGRGSRSRSS